MSIEQGVELNNTGMTLVGNALLLGYAFAVVQRRGQIWDENESRKDRREYAERRELREVLLLAGALDVRLNAGDTSETLGDWDRRIETLAHSQADIAQICTLDLSIPKNMQEKHGIFANVDLIDAFELRLPFAQLGPTPHTRTILRMVLEYFRSSSAKDLLKAGVAECEGRVSKQETTMDKAETAGQSIYAGARSTGRSSGGSPGRGYVNSDRPFVEEGVQMIRNEEARSAQEAARILVAKYGVVLVSEWRPGCKAIRTSSKHNTEGRLQKKIRLAFKPSR